MFLKIVVLKTFAIFIGKDLCSSLFLIKLQTWRTLLKSDSNTGRVFTVYIANFLTTAFSTEHLWWLLLDSIKRYPDNCPWRKLSPPVRVRISFRVGGQFSSGATVLEPHKTCLIKTFNFHIPNKAWGLVKHVDFEIPSWQLLVHCQQWEHYNNVRNLFGCLSGVFIVNFEQIS